MSSAAHAVFLSYASQDADAARKIAESLRSAAVEVWFDQNELVGGDAWDQKIRKQIKECALFVPVISANTQARAEGYFRLEWRLAVERSRLMADDQPFFLPVVIDATADAVARVPEEFRAVQWTRLPGGETNAAFCARVGRLIEGELGARPPPAAPSEMRPRAAALPRKRRVAPAIAATAVACVALGLWGSGFLNPKPKTQNSKPPLAAPPTAAAQFVAKAWEQMDKVEMARNELMLAETYCRQAAALEETNPEVWAAWSAMNTWLYFHGFERIPARKEAARDYAQKALALDARSFTARYASALYLVRNEERPVDAQRAVPVLRELLRERPDEPRVLFALGFQLAAEAATLDEGVQLLERLAEKTPAFAARALQEVGWVSLYWGRFAQAESAAQRAVAAQPYWNNLGLLATIALRVKGDVNQAQAAIDRMPTSALQEDWGIGQACLVAEWRGDYERALATLQAVPRDWIQHFFFQGPTAALRGKVRLKLNQAASAQKELQRGLELLNARLEKNPSDGWLLWVKAETLLLLERKEEAMQTYRQQREVWPDTVLTLTFEPPDAALQYVRTMLQRAYGEGFVPRWFFSSASLRLDPAFAQLRPLPAFQALIAEEERREKAQGAAAVGKPAAITTVVRDANSAPAEKSVAVLPFRNLSGDPSREFFSDGLSEVLSQVLGRVPGLRVIGSASAASLKGRSVPIPEIARQLGVSYIVEGTVLQDGATVRITAQLSRADGFQVWVSDNLDRELKKILALYDEVGGLIARELSLKLGASSPAGIASVDPEAFRLYLEGRQEWNQRSSVGFVRAQELFEQAIRHDPTFARAYVGLADVLVYVGERLTDLPERQARRARARALLDQALALDPMLAEAHVSRGWFFAIEESEEAAEAAVRRGLALNPNYATGRQWLGLFLASRGQFAAGLNEAKLAHQLEPLSPIIVSAYALTFNISHRWTEALEWAERARQLKPDSRFPLFNRARALLGLKRQAEVLELRREILEVDPIPEAFALTYLAEAGDRATAETYAASFLARVERDTPVPASVASVPTHPLVVFRLYVALGRIDEAFSYLERNARAILQLSGELQAAAFDGVREDPRFLRALERSGLAARYRQAQANLLALKREAAP